MLSANGLHQQMTPDPFDTTHAQKVLQSTPTTMLTQVHSTPSTIEWGSGPRPSTISSGGPNMDVSPSSNSVFESGSPLIHSNGLNLNHALVATPRSAVDWSLSGTELLQPLPLNGNGNANGNANEETKPKQEFGSPNVVNSLDDAFSKLVDLDALVGAHKTHAAVFGNKNPFSHVKNPPRPSMNAMVGGAASKDASPSSAMFATPVSAPPLAASYPSMAANPFMSSLPYVPPRSAGMLPPPPVPQMVGGSKGDPFNDDFFN
jgi:hypothetical protein